MHFLKIIHTIKSILIYLFLINIFIKIYYLFKDSNNPFQISLVKQIWSDDLPFQSIRQYLQKTISSSSYIHKPTNINQISSSPNQEIINSTNLTHHLNIITEKINCLSLKLDSLENKLHQTSISNISTELIESSSSSSSHDQTSSFIPILLIVTSIAICSYFIYQYLFTSPVLTMQDNLTSEMTNLIQMQSDYIHFGTHQNLQGANLTQETILDAHRENSEQILSLNDQINSQSYYWKENLTEIKEILQLFLRHLQEEEIQTNTILAIENDSIHILSFIKLIIQTLELDPQIYLSSDDKGLIRSFFHSNR